MTDLVQLTWVGIAAAGGVVRYLDVYLRSGNAPSFGPALGHAAVSGFSGYMTALVVIKIYPDWTMVAAGSGGYLGTQALDWVTTVIKSKVEQQLDVNKKDRQQP